MVKLLILAAIFTGTSTRSESPNLAFKEFTWKDDFKKKLEKVLIKGTGSSSNISIDEKLTPLEKLMSDPTIKNRFPDYTKPPKQTDVQEFIISANIPEHGSRRKMDHTMSIPVPNKSMPDMHNLDEVKVIQSRVNVSLRQCDRVTRVSRSILFQYELRGPDSRRPHISKIIKKSLDDMSFDFNIFEEEGKDTKFIQKAIDAYHPATKFELSVKLRGMSSHCINDMWAVVKYQMKKKSRATRSALRVLDDNNESCGLRKITIDFNHEDYRATFKHIIRKPQHYEYHYCAGKCTASGTHLSMFERFFKSGSSSRGKGHMKPELCCVPDEMESMDLLYYHIDYDTHMMQKIPDMTAVSCKCV